MLYLIISIIGIFFTIFFVIGTHEFAHFIVARLLGIKIIRFSIGFGKKLFAWQDKTGTEYVIAMIPLGGYVKMLDEREEEVPEALLPFAFNHQPFYKKFLVVLAGPAMNLLCAWILYAIIFTVGFTAIKPIIGEVKPDSIAATAGLKPNQEITQINNQPVLTWSNILFRLLSHVGNRDNILIQTKNSKSQKTENHLLDTTYWHINDLTPDLLTSLGITPYQPELPLTIGIIAKSSPAASSSLKIGDKLIAINNMPIKNWNQLIEIINHKPDQMVNFTIKREGKILKLPITIGYERNLILQKKGYLGISPKFDWPKDMLHKIRYNPMTAVSHGGFETIQLSYFNLLLLGKLISGKISLQSLGGPITIFETAGEALNYGLLAFINFLAFLSIAIGVINLIPIPGLDGFHLFTQVIEVIIQRPLPMSVLLVLYRIGFLLLFFLLFQALLNDVLRLF